MGKYTPVARKIPTSDLVNKIFMFCEVYSGRKYYPYQAQLAKRIIRSVIENDGAEITALFSRQSGKTESIAITVGGLMIILPQLANMPMFQDDDRLKMFKDGFWVGIFAPSQRQAQTTYNRMKGRLQCREAIEVLNDPDFNLIFTTSNGQTVALSNGSFCTAISASDNSNIEGESFKFILLEECQDISNFKITKSIHPMAAAYNGTIAKIGTATTFKGNFYESIQKNKMEREQNIAPIQNHFEYNYKVVMRYNEQYRKYIEREKRSLGENSDAFRMSYNLEWIIARGMFVDIEKMEKECGESWLSRCKYDKIATHIVGIDVGGGSSKGTSTDSTVITVVEVDWNNPVVMESTYDEELNQDVVYTAYNTYIKDWLEIDTGVAENYEAQYYMIMDYLKNFKVVRVVVDATREASLGQRLQANLNGIDTVLFTFSSKSKSELYKNLQTEINTGRAKFPTSLATKETREYRKFMQQMADLEKSYSGSNLVVRHPDVRGAHDDYSDSWALAIWGSKDRGQVDNTETYKRGDVIKVHQSNNVFLTRNKFTARRR